MKPNNQHTTPEQRFFFPNGNEAEHHENFETAGLPGVEMLKGDVGYVVTTDENDRETVTFVNNYGDHASGQRVTKIIGLHHSVLEHEAAHDAATYVPQQGDLFVVRAHMELHQLRAPLFVAHNLRNTFVVPVLERLPYANGGESGSAHEFVRYDIEGVITSDLRLLGWPGSKSSHVTRLLDLCIANEHVQNRIELGLLSDSLHPDQLVSSINACGVLKTYLEHFDSAHDTHYLPIVEPYERHRDLPRLNEQQREDYFALSALASNIKPLQRS